MNLLMREIISRLRRLATGAMTVSGRLRQADTLRGTGQLHLNRWRLKSRLKGVPPTVGLRRRSRVHAGGRSAVTLHRREFHSPASLRCALRGLTCLAPTHDPLFHHHRFPLLCDCYPFLNYSYALLCRSYLLFYHSYPFPNHCYRLLYDSYPLLCHCYRLLYDCYALHFDCYHRSNSKVSLFSC
jgi:hypothetical protein